MIENIGQSLPSILATSIAMIFMSGLTLVVARRAGIGEMSERADAVSDKLVARQAETIKLLEARIAVLEKELSESLAREKIANERIDALEKLVSDEQIRRAMRER